MATKIISFLSIITIIASYVVEPSGIPSPSLGISTTNFNNTSPIETYGDFFYVGGFNGIVYKLNLETLALEGQFPPNTPDDQVMDFELF